MNTLDDNSIYLYLAKIRYNWIDYSIKKNLNKRFNIVKNDPDLDSKLLNWAQKEFFPIEKEENEIIPRDQWDLEGIFGVKEEALYHKHYNVWWDYVYKNHHPKHNVCLVFECSNIKPYFRNKSLRYYLSRYHEYCDFASIDYGIMPWEYVNLYPVRYDEWDHGAESEEMAYKYSELTKKRILEYHEHFPDQHLIFICQNDHPQRPVNELYNANINDFRSWVTICTDSEFRAKYGALYSHLRPGLKVLRLLTSKFLHGAIKSCVEKVIGREIIFPNKVKPYNPYVDK